MPSRSKCFLSHDRSCRSDDLGNATTAAIFESLVKSFPGFFCVPVTSPSSDADIARTQSGEVLLSEKIFSSFLTGQCLEAVILGTMFFVTLSVMKLPYALLIGVLIAFTALIPIFGAFIGLGVGAFLMLMVSPTSALIFVITFFVLQQIEGNLIYPHVVGNSVGLPSIWVLAAVTIGGSLMGVVGMLIFIPLCSVLYALLREAVHKRLDDQAKNKKSA